MNTSKINKYLITRYTVAGVIAAVLFSMIFLIFNFIDSSLQVNNSVLKNFSSVQDSLFRIKDQFTTFRKQEISSKRNLIKRKLDRQLNDLKNTSFLKELNFNENLNSIKNFNSLLNQLKIQIQNITITYRSLSAEEKFDPHSKYFKEVEESIRKLNFLLNRLSFLVSENHQKMVSDFNNYNILIWLAGMISLHLIIIFIFKPTLKKITSVMDDLQKEKENAESIATAKSDYLATLSYQIRTPLNGVLGLSDLLLKTNINIEQREYLELVKDSGENLLQVINDIFDYSKIETGNLELEETYFSLEQCIKNIIKIYMPRCLEKKIELVYIIEHDIPKFIFGDPQRLTQCISKLIDNAIKYTRKGEVFIRINQLNNYDNIHEIQFSISDTGIGIPDGKLKTLFNPMPQSEAPVARRFEGAGLGLAIVSRLVHLMKGRIWVESEINKGTTFFIAAKFHSKGESEDILIDSDLNFLNQKHILIIDGNESNRKLLSILCHNWGMQPRNLENPKNLLNILKNEQFLDFIIIDYEILQNNEFELLKNIKNLGHDTTPIIYMHHEKIDYLKEEGLLFLSKPVDKSAFLELLLNWLKARNMKNLNTIEPHIRKTKLNLLLAEDNLINQKLMEKMVSQLGYNLDIAQDGNQAISMAGKTKYDVIFMDLQMPEIDGVAATKIILGSSDDPKPKIVAMTANVQQKDKELCFEAGMIDYYAKPISFENIKKLLNHWESTK